MKFEEKANRQQHIVDILVKEYIDKYGENRPIFRKRR
jgi:hypothetical protein